MLLEVFNASTIGAIFFG